MVEGDGCHRVAREHKKQLLGRKLIASSPNGKFKGGAAALNKIGGVLRRIEVHGKNMFYFFGSKGKGSMVVVHVHFGMAGQFGTFHEEPETTDNTRLRLETVDSGRKLFAHLSAMTVEHGTIEKMYTRLIQRLGPDPLREDARPDYFIACCAKAKKPIGGVMMDQSCLAGVGNIYRSETLYEAGIHPEQPANTVTRAELLKLWAIVVKQMQAGFVTGSIWGKKKGPCCYMLSKSACGGRVREWIMGGRNVFACRKRQLLQKNRPVAVTEQLAVKTGTAHLKKMTSAAKAEKKKYKLGEGLGVQHVALKDDATRKGAAKNAKTKRAAMKARKDKKVSTTKIAKKKVGVSQSSKRRKICGSSMRAGS
eukprot:TRINITY_DN38247_c0_g1_i1.p1 TRINITY_DN38247_c0_g1~~TRINITY_DN38247_c0_g1_i1.p1  ORF type:complete len:365 (+),score=78.11 TRINITY_DN38247_c0_g1_i1:61-1155(+)